MVGIPHHVDDKHLEPKVLSIFQKVGCTITPEFIDDCHRLGGTVKIKIDENSKPLAITHLDDLAINLPGVDLLPSPKAS